MLGTAPPARGVIASMSRTLGGRWRFMWSVVVGDSPARLGAASAVGPPPVVSASRTRNSYRRPYRRSTASASTGTSETGRPGGTFINRWSSVVETTNEPPRQLTYQGGSHSWLLCSTGATSDQRSSRATPRSTPILSGAFTFDRDVQPVPPAGRTSTR